MTNNESREAFEAVIKTYFIKADDEFGAYHLDEGTLYFIFGLGEKRRDPEIDALKAALHKATRSLELAGFTDNGAELWKPPLGNDAALKARIAELEAHLTATTMSGSKTTNRNGVVMKHHYKAALAAVEEDIAYFRHNEYSEVDTLDCAYSLKTIFADLYLIRHALKGMIALMQEPSEAMVVDCATAIIIARDGERDGKRRMQDKVIRAAYINDARAAIKAMRDQLLNEVFSADWSDKTVCLSKNAETESQKECVK